MLRFLEQLLEVEGSGFINVAGAQLHIGNIHAQLFDFGLNGFIIGPISQDLLQGGNSLFRLPLRLQIASPSHIAALQILLRLSIMRVLEDLFILAYGFSVVA